MKSLEFITSEHSPITRRNFLGKSAKALLGLPLLAGSASVARCSLFPSEGDGFIRPARHWRRAGQGRVQCELCPNACVLGPGERGLCRVRENRSGALVTLVYGRLAAMHVDPIEKKPFNHFLPGSSAFSVATAGCNLRCRFCQNWQLSQSRPEDLSAESVSPASLAARARERRAPVIAFTYNEPSIQFEYVMDAASAARERGLRPVIVSAGHISPAAAKEYCRVLSAVKIDLKSFSERFYADVCGGSLAAVQRTLEIVKSSGVWLEIVVLVIPTMNDSPGEIRRMACWIVQNLSADVPLHFTRFHPMYMMQNLPPTPVDTLERCREIARAEGVRYAYVGNLPGHRWEHTYCHRCNRVVVRRSGIYSTENLLRAGRCTGCGSAIPGVWA